MEYTSCFILTNARLFYVNLIYEELDLLCLVSGNFLKSFSFHTEFTNGLCCFAGNILRSFSLCTNFRKLMNTAQSDESLPIVHGIRVLSMVWIVLGHTYLNYDYQQIQNLVEIPTLGDDFLFQIICNGSFSVDTFFFLSGMLVAYGTIRLADRMGKAPPISIFLLRRIVRLLPGLLFAMGAVLLLPLLGSGPLWRETVEPMAQGCRSYGWLNLLFVNNLVHRDPPRICIKFCFKLKKSATETYELIKEAFGDAALSL
ncbi:hypothetical protein LAZ67_10000855 [Cordylochernes scorpioides]|uniref:Acyltransferase 3 domain-containing protein n=1 Tax=Cordylochernes scorpioides TaxID=51811 RepID=A0ABY6KXG5_9ARAC|nr:hypothetical protein LAZ67_10000855 [Cordylochernes scorpioides]